LFTQPGSEAVDDGATFFLTGDTTLLVGSATYLVFDPVKFGDASERLAGNGCRTGGSQFIEAASDWDQQKASDTVFLAASGLYPL
jgi:hypothetical protein